MVLSRKNPKITSKLRTSGSTRFNGRFSIIRFVKSPFVWFPVLAIMLAGCQIFFERDVFIADEIINRESVEIDIGSTSHSVSVLRAGDPAGQRVIFVHGTPGSASNWRNYLYNVPDGREYLAIDRPGFGLSKPRREIVKLDEQAAALEPLLVERNGKWPILVGHSLGGPIIAAAAANYPDRIGGIIELAGSLDPAQEKIKFIQYIGEIPPIVWLIPRALKHTNREIFALKKELITLKGKLGKITTPVMVIHGTNDDLVPYENVPYMMQAFSGASHLELITLKGQNHFLPWNSVKVLNAALDRMVDGFPGGQMQEVVLDLSSMTKVEGFSPPGAIFQSDAR